MIAWFTALGIMAIAGYDPRGAISGLYHAYGNTHTKGSANKSHPEMDQRIRVLSEEIIHSRWMPPGTMNRRDFNTFRVALVRAG